MPETKHTPGPLTRIRSRKHPGAIFFKQPYEHSQTEDNFVCKFYPNHEGDASLFEAAPDLLAACIACANALESCRDDNHCEGLNNFINQADEALRKAKGGK